MSRMQVPYEFFYAGLAGDVSNLTPLGIAGFYPGRAPEDADYGFIAYAPATPQVPTATTEGEVIFADGDFDLEIVLDRDADVDDLGPIETRLMTLFHQKQFVSTASGQVESCLWRRTWDQPYEPVSGTYPRRILRFEVVVN